MNSKFRVVGCLRYYDNSALHKRTSPFPGISYFHAATHYFFVIVKFN